MAATQTLPKVTLPGVRADRQIPQRKIDYGKKLKQLLSDYNTCLIVTVDNVGSSQIAQMRKDFRGRARFLFGKNTLIRKIIREYMKETGNKKLMKLLDLVRGNCGFVFVKGDFSAIRKEIISRKVQCPAKAGTVAPTDVFVPPGPTGMEPTQTTFFQAMNIGTRINKGQIDIVDEVHLIKQGEKVGLSQSVLLTKLNIKPFYYGMKVKSIYDDGKAMDASVLDITDEEIANAFYNGLKNISSLCYEINMPIILNVPHSMINAYKKVLSLGLSLNSYSWDKLKTVKDMLENPGAYASAGPAVGGGGGGAAAKGGAAAAPAKEATPEPKSESKGAAQNMFGGNDTSESD
jgi:large subunit ribosomal protein LP0